MNLAPAFSVGFILLPNFTMTPFSGLIDMLRLSADDGDRSRPRRVHWRVAGNAPVTSSAGLRVTPDEPIGDLARFDYVIVCGGLLTVDDQTDHALLAALRSARVVIGLCTASFTLAAAGLLDGRRACVSWFHHAAFEAAYPHVAVSGTELFVIDGPVITCAGGTGAIDVGAWLVERHIGPATAQKALDILLAAEGRPEGAPQPHRATRKLKDRRLQTATLLIEQRLGSPPNVGELAATIGISERQLSRLFVAETGLTPSAFVRDSRLDQSLWLMETTSHSLTRIATETGFSDAAHFSHVFRQRFGMAPSKMERTAGMTVRNQKRYDKQPGFIPLSGS